MWSLYKPLRCVFSTPGRADIDGMAKAARPSDIKVMAGLRLRAARIALGILRQEALAKLLGVTPTAYSNYENGTRLPDVYAMVRLLEVTGIGPDWIYGGLLRGVPFELANKLRAAAQKVGANLGGTVPNQPSLIASQTTADMD